MFRFVPFIYPKTLDSKYICCLDNAGVLRSRREQLGLTQYQVAEMAHVQFSQYQRLESGERDISGCSLKAGLAICAVLLLDPFELTGVTVSQPDPSTMRELPPVDIEVPNFFRKKAGRKQIRRDIMTVYINYEDYFILVPYCVLHKLGDTRYIQIQWNIAERRIAICAVTEYDEGALDIPETNFENSILAIPRLLVEDNPVAAMNWGRETYAVESRLVVDINGKKVILIDLNTAKPEEKPIDGALLTPRCLIDDSDDDFDNEEDFEKV